MVADAVVLGLLCLAGCALVITAVPSVAATCTVLRRATTEGSLLGEFLAAFRRHLRRGLQIGLIGTMTWGVVAVDVVYVLAHPAGILRSLVLGLAIVLSVVVLAASVWVPALLQVRELSVPAILRAAVVLGFGRPRITAVCLVAAGCAAIAVLALPPAAPLVAYGMARVLVHLT